MMPALLRIVILQDSQLALFLSHSQRLLYPVPHSTSAWGLVHSQISSQSLSTDYHMQVPVMVRVEVEKAQRLQFQVTVASPDGNSTSSLKDSICQLLAKL